MTCRLLVSVRNASEALVALDGGASLIDAKEPRHGPLGRPNAKVAESIIKVAKGRAAVSMALGDFRLGLQPPLQGMDFAKCGFANWRRRRNWPRLWSAFCATWPHNCKTVAVAYADAARAHAPDVGDIVDVSVGCNVQALLIDTFAKDGSTLLDWLSIGDLQSIIVRCKIHGVAVALAGSLTELEIDQLLPLQPSWIAVRGAACTGGRHGTVQLEKVRALSKRIRLGPNHLADNLAAG